MKPDLKTWFKDQGDRVLGGLPTTRHSNVLIYQDFKPDFNERCSIYLQLHGIGIALYEDGTFHIEDTTGG